MLKFLGGEGSSFRLDQDSAGRFISQITVGNDHMGPEYASREKILSRVNFFRPLEVPVS